MTIANDLYDFLESSLPAVTFAQTFAPVDSVPPLVEITMQQNRRNRTTHGTNASFITEFEFECWEKTTTAAEALAASVITLLQDYTGDLNGTSDVQATRIFNEFQGSDGAADLYYSTFTIVFTHQVT